MGFLDKITSPVASLGSGLIGGVTNLIGASMQNKAQAKEAEKARNFQKEERELQNQWNLDMWNMQNEYNTPEQQMQRMIEAGINPAAAAQGISGSGSTAGAVQGASNGAGIKADVVNPLGNLGEAIGNSVNGMMAMRQGAADLELKKEQVNALNLDNQMREKDLGIKQNELDISNQTKEDRIKEVRSLADKAVADKEISEVQRDIINQTAPYLIGKTEEELKQLKNDVELGKAAIIEKNQVIDNLKEQKKAITQQIKTMKAQEANYNASTGLMQEQAETQDKQQQILDLEKQAKEIDNRIKAQEEEKNRIYLENLSLLGIDPNLDSFDRMVMHWKKIGKSDDDAVNVMSALGATTDWLLGRAGGIVTGVVAGGVAGKASAAKAAAKSKYQPRGNEITNPNYKPVNGFNTSGSR